MVYTISSAPFISLTDLILLNFWTQTKSLPSTVMVYTISSAPFISLTDLVLFCPPFLAFCTLTILPSSQVTVATTSLPSGVVPSNGSPSLNLSSIVLRVVDVLMVQTPPSSDTSITGVDTVAAFLNRKFTSNSLSNSSYLSATVLSYFPLNASMLMSLVSLMSLAATARLTCLPVSSKESKLTGAEATLGRVEERRIYNN